VASIYAYSERIKFEYIRQLSSSCYFSVRQTRFRGEGEPVGVIHSELTDVVELSETIDGLVPQGRNTGRNKWEMLYLAEIGVISWKNQKAPKGRSQTHLLHKSVRIV
jgi:hypothetical protein